MKISPDYGMWSYIEAMHILEEYLEASACYIY